MARYMDEQLIKALADEAVKELAAFRSTDAKKEMKNLAKKVLGRAVPKKDDIFWPAGMLLLGLTEAGRLIDVKNYVDAWIEAGSPTAYVDDALTGYSVLRLYEETGDPRYAVAAKKIADFLLATPKDAEDSIIYGPGKGNEYIYADGCGMTALFLSHYGKVLDIPECTALAAKQLRNFLSHGMDSKTGLPYHGYDLSTGICHGIIGWGRAVGWFIMGLAGYLEENQDAELQAEMEKLIQNAFIYLRDDKLFSWQLEATKGNLDTSATGMIAWAITKYSKANEPAAEETEKDTESAAAGEQQASIAAKAQLPAIAEALLTQIKGGTVYGASAECIDFAQYRQAFGSFPWGQGAVLAFYSILE